MRNSVTTFQQYDVRKTITTFQCDVRKTKGRQARKEEGGRGFFLPRWFWEVQPLTVSLSLFLTRSHRHIYLYMACDKFSHCSSKVVLLLTGTLCARSVRILLHCHGQYENTPDRVFSKSCARFFLRRAWPTWRGPSTNIY